MNAAFQHRHAAHCESGAISTLFCHHDLPISEAMAFGLASALSFVYLPFVKLQGMPLIAYRMPPKAIIKGLSKIFAARFRFETFRSPQAGQERLDALLAEGRVVGLQTSVYWLPYFPEDMRFHFNAHNLLVYGKEQHEYLISDPVFEEPVRCTDADLSRARFAKGLLAPKGLLYFPEHIGRKEITVQAIRAAIKKNVRSMLAPVPIAGVRGMRMLANKVESLSTAKSADAVNPASAQFIGHIVRMQEEIGTGGAGFRFLYAAFLQEAAGHESLKMLSAFSERLMEIGDNWRSFALRAARMIKSREPFDPGVLAQLLREQAKQEEAFFRDLQSAVA
ncbi:MAG TPA: BtrH N-terminal domain-containing protein [Rhodocyclaceae bacterium]|nr:BtrH N-terminal domain-containing protein [Rhodocyclaceae bacterium]